VVDTINQLLPRQKVMFSRGHPRISIPAVKRARLLIPASSNHLEFH
jgi:hypothetical protein